MSLNPLLALIFSITVVKGVETAKKFDKKNFCEKFQFLHSFYPFDNSNRKTKASNGFSDPENHRIDTPHDYVYSKMENEKSAILSRWR